MAKKSKSVNTKPSPNFTWEELACKDAARTPYPEELREIYGQRLLKVLEIIREECGDVPLYILSGYRTREHNAIIPGSASGSKHIEGKAVDIARPFVLTFGEFVAAVFRARERCPELVGGIGIYPSRNSIHIDIRESDWLAFWTG